MHRRVPGAVLASVELPSPGPPRGRDWGSSRRRPVPRRRDTSVMTMYLSNRDVRPTGYEVCEFLESPAIPAPAEPKTGPHAVDDEDEEG